MIERMRWRQIADIRPAHCGRVAIALTVTHHGGTAPLRSVGGTGEITHNYFTLLAFEQ